MAIIRSKIARQLLAEGGAPRVPFRSGGRTDANTMSGSGYTSDANPSSTGFEGSPEMLGQGTATTTTYGGPVGDGGDDPPFVDTFRANQLKKQIDIILGDNKPSLSFIANILKGPQREVYNKDIIGPDLDQYGISGKNLTRAKNIQEEIDNYEKTGRLSQPDFEKAFFGPGGKPPRGEGGDNEPIRKLKAPITEKIEEPKDEFDDILKFYGARFAEGGSPGNTTSQRVLPRADGRRPGYYGSDAGFGDDDYKDESASFDAGSGSGGSDQDFAAARAAIMGPSTYTDDGGRTIDVSGLQKQGFTQSKIAEMLGPLAAQYGLQQEQPEVLGVLGEAGPSVTFGQEVTKGPEITGATVTQPTGIEGLGDLKQDALEIGRSISDPGSLFGKALTAGQAAVEREQSLRDRFGIDKADGGAIRQNYGLGSIVKKATRAVKKVAKSPLGKAALAFGAYKLAGSPKIFGEGSFIGKLTADKAFKGILGASLAAGLYAKKEEEDETLPTVSNTDPEFQKYLAFYGGPRRFAEGGGDIDEAPMESMPRQEMASKPSSFAELNMLSLDLFGRPYDQLNDSEQEILMEYFSKSKDMPERTMAAGGGMMNPNDEMLNLGGNEMDLRGGGFVPLGEYEKKDDVPARLSKNEFVFTADAVRAAGGGSVDRGADLMYKTMKQLENKVV